jgi:hypothetical protein|nr:MAG TPA: Preprotein translocase subunit Sec66 [Caudoviricetes sp.]
MAKIIIGIIIGVLIVLSIIYRKQVKDGFITVKAFFQKIVGKIKSRKK